MGDEEVKSERDRPIESLDKALIDGLGDSQLIDFAADIADQALDSLLSEGVIKDIPILGHAVKLWRGGVQVQSYLFARKLVLFLSQLDRTPLDTRQEFVQKINTDPKQRRKVGEQLLLLLDRMDDLEKPAILSWAFGAYVAGRISYDTFRKLGHAIDHCALSDLLALKGNVIYNPNFFDEGIGTYVLILVRDTATLSRLVAAGLLFHETNGVTVTDIGAVLDKVLRGETADLV
jgi:hypothetical protein